MSTIYEDPNEPLSLEPGRYKFVFEGEVAVTSYNSLIGFTLISSHPHERTQRIYEFLANRYRELKSLEEIEE